MEQIIVVLSSYFEILADFRVL